MYEVIMYLTKKREYDIREDATPWPSSALAALARSGQAAVAAVIALHIEVLVRFALKCMLFNE